LKVVEQIMRAERGAVELFVILLGTTGDAAAVEQKLSTALVGVSELRPHLEVVAIPDSAALSGLASSLRTERMMPPVEKAPPPGEQATTGRTLVHKAVLEHWPEHALGAIGAMWIEADADATGLRLAIVRVGVPMAEAARVLLERAVSTTLQTSVTVVDRPVPKGLDASEGPLAFLVALGRLLEASKALPDARICVSEPPTARMASRLRRELDSTRAALQELAAKSPRLTLAPGAELRAELTTGTCPLTVESRPHAAGTP
jgi:hypothetical protein